MSLDLSVWRHFETQGFLYRADMPACCVEAAGDGRAAFKCPRCEGAYLPERGNEQARKEASERGHLVGGVLQRAAQRIGGAS